jgi:hypothetical protein
MENLHDFIERCAVLSLESGKSLEWISRKILFDGSRLRQLSDGTSDIGVKRLDRALNDLAALESELSGADA